VALKLSHSKGRTWLKVLDSRVLRKSKVSEGVTDWTLNKVVYEDHDWYCSPMDGACAVYGREKKCIQGFGVQT
jgi:hypothetical protein